MLFWSVTTARARVASLAKTLTPSRTTRRQKGTGQKPSPSVLALWEAGALDEKLQYQPGHEIYTQYHDYKAVHKVAKATNKKV